MARGIVPVGTGVRAGTPQSNLDRRRMGRKTKPDLSFLHLPKYDTEVMGEIVIPRGRGSLSSDLHLPLTSERAIMHLIDNAKRLKATDWLAIPGDYFNYDVLSDYLPKQGDHDLYDEIVMGRRLMRILLGVFDRVIVSLGNHDQRLVRALGYKMRFEHSMAICFGELPEGMRSRIEFTGRDYMLHESEEGLWRFCHTRQYNMRQLAVPSDIADVYQQHVIAGHRHHHALGRSKSGLWCGESGWMCDEDKFSYIQRWTTTHPRMQQGYFCLVNGVPIAPMLHGR